MSLDLDRNEWTLVEFGAIAASISDRVDDPSKSGATRYVGLEHLDSGSMTVTRWGTPDQVEATKLRFQPGDVIFGRRRAYQRKVARADFGGICSAHAMVLRAKPDVVYPDFLPIFLSSDAFMDRAISISVGSLSPTVNWKSLAIQEFLLPPLDQQRPIAELLWATESQLVSLLNCAAALRAVRNQWLDETVDILMAASTTTIGSLAASGVVRLLTGPFGTALSSKEFISGGVPVIHPSNIKNGLVLSDDKATLPTAVAERVARWKVNQGDIVLMRKGDVGRSGLIGPQSVGWVLGSDCISVRSLQPDRLNPAYLQLVLSAPRQQADLLRRAPGTTMPGINEKSLAPMAVPLIAPADQLDVLAKAETLLGATQAMALEIQELRNLRRSFLRGLWGDA